MPKIFVSTFPFGISDSTPRNILADTGWEIQYNPHNRKLSSTELADFAKNADGIIAGTENLKAMIDVNPNLRFISRVGIGLDSVPLQLCKERGIKVSYTPDAVTSAVAELTIGLMVSITRFIHQSDREIRTNKFSRPVGMRIENSKIGLIGFGRVGKYVAKLLSGFGVKEILFNDIQEKSNEIKEFSEKFNLNLRSTSKEEIYEVSDIVSLHLPLYEKTKHIINKETLKQFSKKTFLINTARGDLIEENDLYHALSDNQIAGAALDVFSSEPYKGVFSNLENIILTQHIGSCSYDCRYSMEIQSAEEIIRFFQGKPLLREVPIAEYQYQ